MYKSVNLNFKGDIIVYLAASVFNAGLSFVFTVILTFFLEPAEIGKIENFVSFSSLLTAVILFGSSTHLVRFYSEKRENHFQTILNGITVNSVLITFIILSICAFLDVENFVLLCVLLYSISTSIYSIIVTSYQLEKKSVLYAKTIVSYGLINFFLSSAFIYMYQSGNARIGSISVTATFICIYVYARFDKLVIPKIRFEKSFYSLGYILFFGQLLSWIIEKSDRILITEFLDTASTGKYGIGYQFGMIVLLVQVAISRAWMPRIMDNFNDKRLNTIKRDILKVSIILFILSCILSAFSYYFITRYLDEDYLISATIAVIVSFGYMIDGIWKLYSNILIYFNEYTKTTLAVCVAGFVNVSLNYLFLSDYGIVCAAFSTLFSFSVGLIISFLFVHNKFKKLV